MIYLSLVIMSTNIDAQDAFVRPPERRVKANPEFRGPVAERAVIVVDLFQRTEDIVRMSDPSIVRDAEVHQLPVADAPADPDIAHLYVEEPIVELIAGPTALEPMPQPVMEPPVEQFAPAATDVQPTHQPIHDNEAFLHGARHLVDASLPAGSVDIRGYVERTDGSPSQIIDFPMPTESYDVDVSSVDADDQSFGALGYEELQDDAA